MCAIALQAISAIAALAATAGRKGTEESQREEQKRLVGFNRKAFFIADQGHLLPSLVRDSPFGCSIISATWEGKEILPAEPDPLDLFVADVAHYGVTVPFVYMHEA